MSNLDVAVLNQPPPERSVLEQAIAAHRNGRVAEAEALYHKFLDGFPGDAGANHNLGILLAQKGRPDLGAAHLKRAAEAAPAQVQHWISWAEALFAAGEPDQARQVLATARAKGLAGVEEALARMAAASASRWLQEAVRHHQSGRFEQAAEVYRKVLELQPNLPEVHSNLGSALKAARRASEAKEAFGRAIALSPGLANAHFNLGNLQREEGDWDAAAGAYRAAVQSNPNFSEGHNNLGLALLALGKPDEALGCFRRAIQLKGVFPSAYNNLGQALRQTGRTADARAAFETASQQDPNLAEAHNNLGVLLSDGGQIQEAEACFQRALALKPDYVEAHNNLANLRVKHGGEKGLADGIRHYENALSLDPAFIEAYDHLGVTLCKAHRVAEGFTWLTRGARQRRAPELRNAPAHKINHDQEQRSYRARFGLGDGEGLQVESGNALSSPAINRHPEAEAQWQSARPQIIVIDDLLTAEALAALRHFCLASTIWDESFEEGYVGARPESGFASPLLAQIADELRAAYPTIFRDYPLLYAWSFKYDNRLRGTKIHADFAAVNVNFWITPDEANLDPETGGLKVWDVAAPLDWDFERYNRDEPAIRQFLHQCQAKAVRIPYRANRAVIFDSDLFHETDKMSFADGYENRRINITLLYGDRRTA